MRTVAEIETRKSKKEAKLRLNQSELNGPNGKMERRPRRRTC